MAGVLWDPGEPVHPLLADLLDAVRRGLGDAGYDALLLNPSRRDQLRRATELGLAGVVMLGVNPRDRAVEELAASPLPCVGVDLDLRGPRSAWITSDNLGGAATAVRHLYDTGRRRIATVTGPMQFRPAVERLLGYRRELGRLGLACPPEYTVEGDWLADGGGRALRRLLALPEPPDGVFVAGDLMALGAVHAAGEAGVRVPADLGIVAFDDVAVAGYTRPRLTTIRQDTAAFGRSAAALLGSLREGPPDAPCPPPVVLPAALVVRESCGGRMMSP